ncbi:MAG: hypothetical protein HGN29_07185 [Asgard group archaeon]|nr:hypothetical protein [Asgard group archaeon]
MTRKKHYFFLMSFLILFTLTTTLIPSQAHSKIFDQNFSTEDQYIFVNYRIKVWSNQHIEVYSTYRHHSTNQSMCAFYYLAIKIGFGGGTIYHNSDITQEAPGENQYAYLDCYGDLDQEDWETGRAYMSISVQMRTFSVEYETKFAVFGLILYNWYGTGWAITQHDWVELNTDPLFPDYTFWP